ncbi:hypothetical protein ACFFWB_27205 [Flavobacterium procerum]
MEKKSGLENTFYSRKMLVRPVYTFDGDVYTGLDAYTIPLEKIGCSSR